MTAQEIIEAIQNKEKMYRELIEMYEANTLSGRDLKLMWESIKFLMEELEIDPIP